MVPRGAPARGGMGSISNRGGAMNRGKPMHRGNMNRGGGHSGGPNRGNFNQVSLVNMQRLLLLVCVWGGESRPLSPQYHYACPFERDFLNYFFINRNIVAVEEISRIVVDLATGMETLA